MRVLGRVLAVIAAIVLLVAVGVVVADQPLRSYVQDTAATTLQRQVPFTDKPTVTLEGWPLVYSALGGSLTAKLKADGMPVTASGKTITLSNLQVGFQHLRIKQDATGGRAVSWAGAAYSASRWGGSAAAPTLNTNANGESMVTFYYDGTTLMQTLFRVGML